MKILYLNVNPGFTLSGKAGDSVRAVQLIEGWRRLGSEVSVLSSGDVGTNQRARAVYQDYLKRSLPRAIADKLRDTYRILQGRRFKKTIGDFIERWKPDLIVERFASFQKTGVEVANRYDIPIFLDDIFPFWEEEVYFGHRTGWRDKAMRIQEEGFTGADGLIAVSGVIKDYILSSGISASKVFQIPNGYNSEFFDPEVRNGNRIKEKLGLRDMTTIIGFVGAIAPWHHVKLLLEAAERISHMTGRVHFLIVGEGEERQELMAFTESRRLGKRVSFLGYVPYEEIPDHIAAMDIATVPNTAPYQFPIKVVEYMAMGKPVVAPSLKPIHEIMTDGVEGVLFSPMEVEDYARCLLRVINDRGLRVRAGRAARRKVSETYTWDSIARRFIDIHERLSGA
jgi:glycosyltransferase involved in cell wall biosynthesis